MRFLLKLAAGVVMALVLSGLFCQSAQAVGRVYVGGSIHFGHYYGPHYGPWYDPWYDPWYPPGGYYYAPPDHGWLWTRVEPNTAEVWVDGKLFGLVRDFDGPVNHLRLPIGEHEARFTHPEFETYKAVFYIYPGETTSISYDMIPAGGDAGYHESDRRDRETVYGTLLVDVSPGGAKIYVDGEYKATSTVEGGELVITAEGGPRQISITREGYIDYFTEVTVTPGDKKRMSIRLKEKSGE